MLMQRGLTGIFTFADYIYVTDVPKGFNGKQFLMDYGEITCAIRQNNCAPPPEEIAIVAFERNLWNEFVGKTGKTVQNCDITTQWRTCKSSAKQNFFKFDIKILIQVKKTKSLDPTYVLTKKILALFQKHNLYNYTLKPSESTNFCGVNNSIMGGRFNDNVEKPKDPYSFYLHAMIGY